MEAIYHEEGRAVSDGSGEFEYQFRLTDHLGNTRVMFADLNSDGEVTEEEIIQENHYYPGGLEMEGEWTNATAPLQPYTFGGKEYNEDYGLDLLDYGARQRDVTKVVWNQIDPLAEKYVGWSPYNFVLGNPIRFIDPDGRMVGDPPKDGYVHNHRKITLTANKDNSSLLIDNYSETTYNAKNKSKIRTEVSTTVHVSATGEVLGQTQLTETFSIGQQRDFLTGEKKMVSSLVSSEFAQGEDVQVSEQSEALIGSIQANSKQGVNDGFQHLNYKGSGQASIDKTNTVYSKMDWESIGPAYFVARACPPCGQVMVGFGAFSGTVAYATLNINRNQETVSYFQGGSRTHYRNGSVFSVSSNKPEINNVNISLFDDF